MRLVAKAWEASSQPGSDIEVVPVGPAQPSAIRPANFQLDAQEAMDAHFLSERGARGLVCLPTGAGKTLVAVVWLLVRYVAKGLRVLWVTHRVDLLEQVREVIIQEAHRLHGLRPSFTISRYHGQHRDLTGDIILATAQTLARRRPALAEIQRYGPLGLVVFDEVHRSVAQQWWAALERLVRSRRVALLGLTATPFRSTDAGTAKLRRVYGEIPVCEFSFRDLIQRGFLARPIFVRQQINSTRGFEVTDDEVRRARRLGDLPQEVLGRLARDPERTQEIVAHWLSSRETYGKTIVFTCNITHAEAVAAAFRQAGVAAVALHSNLSTEDRALRLQALREGECEVLVNVGLLTEGVDVPDIKTVVMARPTMSEVLYVQMMGRGARGPRTVPGKTQFYVVDCVDAFNRHGLVLASGHEVAEDLGGTLRAARAPRPRSQQAALVSNRVWMHLRGFASSQYTFWGELRWTKPDGADKSVAVFTETLQAIEAAVEHVQHGIESGAWRPAENQAVYLDDLGAARTADWNEMVGDVRETGISPELIAVDAPTTDAHDEEEVAADLVEFVQELATIPMLEGASWCRTAWAERPEWHAFFPNWESLWQQVVNLLPLVLYPQTSDDDVLLNSGASRS